MLSIQAPLGKKYKCSTCDVSFDRPFLLQFHLRTSHGIGKPVTCQYCTRTDFASFASYHSHQSSCEIRVKKQLKLKKKKMNTNTCTRLKMRVQATATLQTNKVQNFYMTMYSVRHILYIKTPLKHNAILMANTVYASFSAYMLALIYDLSVHAGSFKTFE